jgi:hypothetical protein
VCPGRRPLRRLVKRLRPSTSGPVTRTGISAVIAVDVISLEIRRAHVPPPAGITFPHFAQTSGPGFFRPAMGSGAAQTSGGSRARDTDTALLSGRWRRIQVSLTATLRPGGQVRSRVSRGRELERASDMPGTPCI